MKLFSLVYESKVSKNVDRSEIVRIAHQSAISNKAEEITGLLLFENGFFLQRLEGSEAKVRDLYKKISADSRHSDCRVIEESNDSKRDFEAWSMQLIILQDSPKLFDRLGPNFVFDPRTMNAASANRVLKTLRNVFSNQD